MRTCVAGYWGRMATMTASAPGLSIVPANQAACEELAAVFGARGSSSRCQCQRYKLRPREAFGTFPVEERTLRQRQQAECGHPRSTSTSGLVAYLDGGPIGWCAVEPQTAYEGLLGNQRVPWQGRTEDKLDDSVWAVTCVLVRAAVDFARERGARAIEAYPIITKNVIAEELHVGTEDMFVAVGFQSVSHPTPRRVVMRIDFLIESGLVR